MKGIVVFILMLAGVSGFSQSLPDFTFSVPGKSELRKSDLSKDRPVIVFYFDPFCEPCLKQAEVIKKNSAKFANVTMLWVTTESDAALLDEFKTTWFKGLSNVIVCVDNQFKFDQWFGYSEYPAVYAYDATWMRKGSFSDDIDAESLLKAVKERE